MPIRRRRRLVRSLRSGTDTSSARIDSETTIISSAHSNDRGPGTGSGFPLCPSSLSLVVVGCRSLSFSQSAQIVSDCGVGATIKQKNGRHKSTLCVCVTLLPAAESLPGTQTTKRRYRTGVWVRYGGEGRDIVLLLVHLAHIRSGKPDIPSWPAQTREPFWFQLSRSWTVSWAHENKSHSTQLSLAKGFELKHYSKYMCGPFCCGNVTSGPLWMPDGRVHCRRGAGFDHVGDGKQIKQIPCIPGGDNG